MRPKFPRLIPCLLLALYSCGSEAPQEGSTERQFPIPEAVRPDRWAQGGKALTEDPILNIGSLDGAPQYQFENVRGAVRLTDGSIVVADRGTQTLRWYDASGNHRLTAGGRGEGPGEFSGLLSLFTREDTVVAFDERLQRVSVFSSDGTFVRSFPIRTRPGLMKGIFEDGSIMLANVLSDRNEATEGLRRVTRASFHLSSDGEILDSLPSFPDREEVIRSMSTGGGTAVMSVPPAFGKETSISVHGDRFAVGDQTKAEIMVYGMAGEPRVSIAWEEMDRTVTDELLARHRAYQLDKAANPEDQRRIRQMLDQETYPDLLPAHGKIIFDPQGNLWVEPFQLPDQEAIPWMVFDPEGRGLGTISLPGSFVALEIGSDYVLGVAWDELDVQHVQLYGLVGSFSRPSRVP